MTRPSSHLATRPGTPDRGLVALATGLLLLPLASSALREREKPSPALIPTPAAESEVPALARTRRRERPVAQSANDIRATPLTESELREIHAALLAGAPEDAVEFAAEMTDGPLRAELLGRSLPAWAARNWPAARAWVGAQADEILRRTALLHLVHHWSRAAPGELLEFAAAQPAELAQFKTVAATRVAEDAPEKAFVWAARAEDSVRRELVVAVATTWAASNPREVLTRLAKLPEDEARDAGMLAAIGTWAGRDAAAAALWVTDLPAGPLRDAALDELDFRCRVAGHHDPAAWIAASAARRAPGATDDSANFPNP